MSAKGWLLRLVLIGAVSAGLLVLGAHHPFGFGSPDGSFHAAKLLRAEQGQPFVDPFSGTLSIYPALFHSIYGFVGRVAGVEGLPLFRLAGLCNFGLLFVAFFALAAAVLRDGERAALATLWLPLVFYAPTGRHVLLANPANLAIPLLLLGAALLLRSLDGSRAALAAGALVCGLAANVAWYMALPALALIGARLAAAGRASLVRASLVSLPVALAPCAFTAWQFSSIREVLPDYAGFPAVELSRLGGGTLTLALLRDWAVASLTKGNGRFVGLLERSLAARAHYYGLALPVACVLPAVGYVCARRLALGDAPRRPGTMFLATAMLAIFALSLPLAVTRDFPRVVAVQFVAWTLLLVLVVDSLSPALPARFRVAAGAALAAAGGLSLAYTVAHTGQPFVPEPPRTSAAVVDFVLGLPGHADERIFVSERHLRELAPFATFRSFVNHGDGRYYAQDAKSAARLLDAYRSLFERRDDWRETLRAYHVRFLVFRHADGGAEREAALFYLQQGRAALQNAEWWIVEVPVDSTGDAQRPALAPAQ